MSLYADGWVSTTSRANEERAPDEVDGALC